MANKSPITNYEFANAIIVGRPFKSISIKQFLQLLSTPGPKEKHPDWIRVCDVICDARKIPQANRRFRKEAHRLFMENLVEIETIVINYVLDLPMDKVHDADMFEFFNKRLDHCNDQVDKMRKELRRGNK